MEVENQIKIYEINDKEVSIGEDKYLIIKNHWNRDTLIVIKIGKSEYTVSAEELKKAIENATNWRDY